MSDCQHNWNYGDGGRWCACGRVEAGSWVETRKPTPEEMWHYVLSHSDSNFNLLMDNRERIMENPALLARLYENEKSFQKSDEACGR